MGGGIKNFVLKIFISGHRNKRLNSSTITDNLNKPVRKIGTRGPTFKLGGVVVNTKSIATALDDLSALDVIIPSSNEDRANWNLEFKTKSAHFDVEWDILQDSKLLLGIIFSVFLFKKI